MNGDRRWSRTCCTAVGLAAVGTLVLGGCSHSNTSSAKGGDKASGGGNGGTATSADATPVTLAVSPDAATAMSPATPIVVTASHGVLQSVTVSNTAGYQVKGAFSADKTTWTSTEVLGYGKTYQVQATGTASSGGATNQVKQTVHVVSPATQTYPSLIPAPGHTDVGIGQPLVVRFDQPVTDHAAAEKAMTVTSTPVQAGAWYWMSNKEAHYRPKVYWKAGSTVKLAVGIYGLDLGNGVYGQTDRTLTVHIHDSWVAKADGASHTLVVYHNGARVKSMATSLGSTKYPSHTGPHVISAKNPSVVMDSSTYGVGKGQPGYYRETVYWDERISNDGEFVHAAPWSVGSQGSSNVSHGCVNLSVDNAKWFYAHFGVGDVVEITNSGGKQLPVWDTYGDWALSWSEWTAGQ